MRLFSAIFLALLIPFSIHAQNVDDEQILPIAYTRYNAENVDYDLFMMDVNNQEIIYSITTPDYDCPYGFSPNNQYFNYSIGGFTHTNHQGYITDFTTGDEFYLPYLVKAYWSPDSTRIAYIYEQIGFEDTLYAYNFASNSLIPSEIATAFDFENILWSENNLIFSAKDTGISSIYVWNGTEAVQILRDILPEGDFTGTYIAPDGQHLIYEVQHNNESTDFYLIDIETAAISQLDYDYSRISQIKWNPSGTSFAFIGDNNIVVNNLDNNSQELINFRQSIYPGSLEWSPDSNYIAYELETAGSENSTIELLEVSNFTQVSISYSSSWTARFQWVSGSHLVYNHRNDGIHDSSGNLFLYNVMTGETEQLTDSTDIRMRCQWG